MALFHCRDTATVRNQHQLLTCKTSKWRSLLFLETTIFELIIHQKPNQLQYLKTLLRLKTMENFPTTV